LAFPPARHACRLGLADPLNRFPLALTQLLVRPVHDRNRTSFRKRPTENKTAPARWTANAGYRPPYWQVGSGGLWGLRPEAFNAAGLAHWFLPRKSRADRGRRVLPCSQRQQFLVYVRGENVDHNQKRRASTKPRPFVFPSLGLRGRPALRTSFRSSHSRCGSGRDRSSSNHFQLHILARP
jgi:hypothetical protein